MDANAGEPAPDTAPQPSPAFPIQVEIPAADMARKRLSLELALARLRRRERTARRTRMAGIVLACTGAALAVLMLLRLALVQPTWADIAVTGAAALGALPAGLFISIYSHAVVRLLGSQTQVLAQDLAGIQSRSPD